MPTSPRSVRRPWHQCVAPLDRWLKRLKTPVGIMAVHDHLARIVMDECLRLGLDVPHDVAVIGNDNDTIVCDFCRPTLSSVLRNAWQVGYEAAGLLDRLMMGKSPPSRDLFIAPDGVVARQSTDTVAVDDPCLAAALRFMSDHRSETFRLEQLLQYVSISRRQLELRFRRWLDCSPHEYLCQLRVTAAKDLLGRPGSMKLRQIASACGFSSDKHLRQVFHRLVGLTPLEYRRQCREHRKGF